MNAASSFNIPGGLHIQAVHVFSPYGSFRSNRTNGIANLTMKEAVEYLSKKDETYQHWGASYIQHNTFVDDKAKEEVGVVVFLIIWVPCVTGALNCGNLPINKDVHFQRLGFSICKPADSWEFSLGSASLNSLCG